LKLLKIKKMKEIKGNLKMI